MAKVLFCLPRFHTNAVPWARILRSAGHEVAVLVSLVGPTESHEITAPHLIPPSPLRHFFGRRNGPAIDLPPSARQVWRYMRAEAPDLVVVRGASRWLSRIAIVCALLQGRRLAIYDQEDVSPRALGTRLRRAGFRAFGIRHFTVRVAPEAVRPRFWNAITIPFGRPMAEPPSPAPYDRSPVPRILMVAKYRKRKGHTQLLEAMNIVARSGCDFSVVLCGEEAGIEDTVFCEALRERIRDLGLVGRVSFRNNVPHADMGDLYAQHDVFVLPSRNEPAAVSPIEAAWCDCAVLVSADSGTRGYVPPGIDYEFDPCNPADIARAIIGSISSAEILAERKASCRHHIERVAGDSLILSRFERLFPFRSSGDRQGRTNVTGGLA